MSSQTTAGPYQLFMVVLCVYVLVALAAEVFVPLPADAIVVLHMVDTGICVIFFADFLYCLVRAPNRLRYMVTWGWIDLASSIPAVGFLRVGRLRTFHAKTRDIRQCTLNKPSDHRVVRGRSEWGE